MCFPVTIEEGFEALLINGKRICWVCGVEEETQTKRLHIDHCHIIEKTHGIEESVRGLLCHRCNSMAGYLNDSPERIREWAENMVKYLSEHRRKFYEYITSYSILVVGRIVCSNCMDTYISRDGTGNFGGFMKAIQPFWEASTMSVIVTGKQNAI